MSKRLPSPFDVVELRRQASALHADVLAGDLLARERVRRSHPRFGVDRLDGADLAGFTGRDAQLCIARELGFDGWGGVLAYSQRTSVDRPWRRWPDGPDGPLMQRSIRLSEEAGHTHVGPEHALGSLLQPPERTTAVEVLEELGATSQRWAERFGHDLSSEADSSEGRRWRTMNPAWYGFMGFAAGIALAGGADAVGDEHALLALAYGRDGRYPSPLETLGLDPDAVVTALARRGVAASELRPPPRAAAVRPYGPRVYFAKEDFSRIMTALSERYPPSATYWGWNTDGEGVYWVDGEGGLAIEEVIRSAAADQSIIRTEPIEVADERDEVRRRR